MNPGELPKISQAVYRRLRSITGDLKLLRQPLRTRHIPQRPITKPQYLVELPDTDWGDLRDIDGLRSHVRSITVPDETLLQIHYELAGRIWNLGESLQKWVQAKNGGSGCGFNVFSAQVTVEVQICRDLTNRNKHTSDNNSSGTNPALSSVNFDFERNGEKDFYYNGATKRSIIYVALPTPIPFWVDVVNETTEAVVGRALQIYSKAFDHWLCIIRKVGILDQNDREAQSLKKQLLMT